MKDYRKFYARYYGITWDSSRFEVHHIDGNRDNNDIYNLILLPKELHQRLHMCRYFDLGRYETQILQIGMSDQHTDDLEQLFVVLEECRRWAALRAVDYRRPTGARIGEIKEDSAL